MGEAVARELEWDTDRHGLDWAYPSRERVDRRVVQWIDREYASTRHVLATKRLGVETLLAIADPLQARRLEGELVAMAGPIVILRRATEEMIGRAIEKYYPEDTEHRDARGGRGTAALASDRDAGCVAETGGPVPYRLGLPAPESPEEPDPCSFCGGDRRETRLPRFALGGAICEACVADLHDRRRSNRLKSAVAAQLAGELEDRCDEDGLPLLALARFGADERVVPWIDRSFAEANRLIALQQADTRTVVAFADPRQLPALKPRLLAQVGPRITPVRATEDDILRAIARYYPD